TRASSSTHGTAWGTIPAGRDRFGGSGPWARPARATPHGSGGDVQPRRPRRSARLRLLLGLFLGRRRLGGRFRLGGGSGSGLRGGPRLAEFGGTLGAAVGDFATVRRLARDLRPVLLADQLQDAQVRAVT